MRGRHRLVPALALAALIGGCAGTVDVAVEVRGEVRDEKERGYSHCVLRLYRGANPKSALALRQLGGGAFTEWFSLPDVDAGLAFTISCQGAAGGFRSRVFGPGELNPAELGVVELPRKSEGA